MKKVLSVVIILIVIMLGSYIFTLQSDDTKENNTTNNEIVETNKINETSTNEVVNEIINEPKNEVVENEVENTVSSETLEESPKTSKEKAIDIVKKDWGKDSSVNFSVQGMDGNGNYIVVVSNSDTQVLAFYSVNAADETFIKREMN